MRLDHASAGLVLLAMTVGAAACGIAVFLFSHPAMPSSLAAPQPVGTIPVTMQEFVDPRSVDVVVTSDAQVTVRAPREGMVTRLACSVGDTWESGMSVASIDGAPLLSLSTQQPLWRDLTVGDSGPDVAALKKELRRLGHRVSAGRRLAAVDVNAFRAAAADAGLTGTGDIVSIRHVLWLPRRSVVVSECSVRVGDRIGVGDSLAASPGDVQLKIEAPEELLAGSRQLRVDEIVVPLTRDLRVADPASAARVTATLSYRSAAGERPAEGGSVQLTARVELVSAVDVAAVPPSAIRLARGSSGCVAVTPGARPVIANVTILSSELGRTLVRFDGELPDSVATEAPESCT